MQKEKFKYVYFYLKIETLKFISNLQELDFYINTCVRARFLF